MGRGDFHKCDEPLTMERASIKHSININGKKSVCLPFCLFPMGID